MYPAKLSIVGLMAFVLATGLLWVTSVFGQNFTVFETGDELFDVCNVPPKTF
jgi:hypothetical protein